MNYGLTKVIIQLTSIPQVKPRKKSIISDSIFNDNVQAESTNYDLPKKLGDVNQSIVHGKTVCKEASNTHNHLITALAGPAHSPKFSKGQEEEDIEEGIYFNTA